LRRHPPQRLSAVVASMFRALRAAIAWPATMSATPSRSHGATPIASLGAGPRHLRRSLSRNHNRSQSLSRSLSRLLYPHLQHLLQHLLRRRRLQRQRQRLQRRRPRQLRRRPPQRQSAAVASMCKALSAAIAWPATTSATPNRRHGATRSATNGAVPHRCCSIRPRQCHGNVRGLTASLLLPFPRTGEGTTQRLSRAVCLKYVQMHD